MAEKKRKTRDEENKRPKEGEKQKHRRRLDSKTKEERKGARRKKTGPRLPNALRKELDLANLSQNSVSDEDINSDNDANDVYEYEEAIPEEESQKNHRYDPVENFEYELPERFEDENVASDDDEDIDAEYDAENHEDEDLRHSRMLQQVTGLPSEVFEGKKKETDVVISEAYPESEFNPTRDVQDGYGHISINDLLEPLHGKSEFNALRKRVAQMESKSMSVQAPLPKSEQEKLERKAAYEISKKDITKWEPLVKRNREAPTIYFDEDIDLGFSTVGAIASEFEPRTDFEKKIASLVNKNEVVEAHKNDGARLLELNKVSIDEVKDRQNHLAKMRSLLFRHEMKAKRIKKIKSKTYHRISKKDRLKAAASELAMNSEAAKEFARKQAFKRAEERMTLKHKNSSKWARRILERGLSAQDEGTRAALAEQLHQHAVLTRKMNSMKDTSSSDESSDEGEDDEASAGSDHDIESKLLEKAKEKTLKILEEDDEMPKSGVLSLPFMVHGLQKRKEAADEQAKLALQEYESTLKQLDDNTKPSGSKTSSSSGRRVFGAQRKQVEGARSKINQDKSNATIDSEDDSNAEDDVALVEREGNSILHNEVNVDTELFREESEIGHDPLYKSFEDIIKDPGPKTAYEVAIFASNSWAKKKNISKQDNEQMNGGETNSNVNKASKVLEPDLQDQDEEVDEDSGTESEGHMVDGMLSSVSKSTYELPSQGELIRRAFAGDDVEEDFEKDKQEILNEENPEPEKPVLLPGWGQWTHIQKNKGLPSWMLEEHKAAKKKREEALKKRKDAHLKHVVISEKVDKKAEKLHTKTLPYPYTSKEVFEQSIRMPIGPEFNPVTAVGALNRPEVVKKAGVIIKPIKFEDVNPHERGEEQKRSGRKQKNQSVVKRTQKINTKGIKIN